MRLSQIKLLLLFLPLDLFYLVYMSVCEQDAGRSHWRSEEGVGLSASGATKGFELSNVSAGCLL